MLRAGTLRDYQLVSSVGAVLLLIADYFASVILMLILLHDMSKLVGWVAVDAFIV